MTMPILILAGGTGGHIFPGIAVARVLQARGLPIHWLGSRHGLENRLVPEAKLPMTTIPVSALRGRGFAGLLLSPIRLLRALAAAFMEVRRIRPLSVVAFGGFAAGPGGLAAWLLRIPLVVHEQNAVAGFTNRVLAKLARRRLAGFPNALGEGRTEYVGNPVRAEITAVVAPAERLGGREGPLRVLVLGGSQGARSLNDVMPGVIAGLRGAAPEVRHQAGRDRGQALTKGYAAAAPAVSVTVSDFIGDMAEAYGWADLVVARAGALTLAEIAAVGLGAILVPYPHAVDDHQSHNARHHELAGAALTVAEGEGFEQRLAEALGGLMEQGRPRLLAMAQAARALAKPDAADRVAEACVEVAR